MINVQLLITCKRVVSITSQSSKLQDLNKSSREIGEINLILLNFSAVLTIRI